MLFLQFITTALVFSYAKANPVAIDSRNWEYPTTDDVKRDVLEASNFAAMLDNYVPVATDTSLTSRYYEERATCLDQFLWYCIIPGSACVEALKVAATPLGAIWTTPVCVITGICVGLTVLFGALCCNNIIHGCGGGGNFALTQQSGALSTGAFSQINGNHGMNAFTKQQYKDALFNTLKQHGSKKFPSDSEFNTMFQSFIDRAFCSNGPGEGGACSQTSVSFDALSTYLHRP